MGAAGIAVVTERVTGEGRVDRSDSGRQVDRERLPIATPTQLVLLSPTHEIVIERIERKQHSYPSVGLAPEDGEISVGRGSEVGSHPFAGAQIHVLAQAEIDLLLGRSLCPRCGYRIRAWGCQ